MDLLKYLPLSNIVLDLRARDRWEALDEMLSRVLPRAGPEYDRVSKALREAESKKCSAVGRSVTIIHAVTEDVPELKIVFGRSRKGIPWDAPDGRYVTLLWLLIHPERDQGKYLELLAQAVRLCRSDELRKKLLKAGTPEEVAAVISLPGRVRPARRG